MTTYLLSLGTALPEHKYKQADLAETVSAQLNLDKVHNAWYQKLSKMSGIQYRYSTIPDFPNVNVAEKSMSERNAHFAQEAPKLANDAAQKALDQWGGNPQELTHILSITCTGIITPGIEVKLINSLGLNHSIERLGINFMGCFGAFKGLAMAQALARENPMNRILVICTELCSLHLHPTEARETLIGNVLFADGAAAAIVGCNLKPEETPLWELHRRTSLVIENSEKEMTWNAGDRALVMQLTRDVPIAIRSNIRQFVENLREGIPQSDCSWAIHPGGKAILEGIQDACSIDASETTPSWEILAECGNMSSPTFLFVLERLFKKGQKNPWTIGLGFGPGLSVEGVLLKRCAS